MHDLSSDKPAIADEATSRKRFLRMIGGTGGVAAMAVLLGACGDDEDDTSSTPAAAATTEEQAASGDVKGDLDILNYALTLEFLEADFYNKVVEAKLFTGAQGDLIKQFGESEQAHVDALKSTIEKLGGTPVTAPETNFDVSDAKAVAELAAVVENLGANAYLAQAPKIKNAEILAAALSIHSVEARHAAVLQMVIGKTVTPDGAFGKPAEMAEVLKAVKPFIVS